MTIDTTSLDADTDKVKAARPSLLAGIQRLNDLAASLGASFVGFLQSGTSAVVRTVQDKLRDTATVEDFGAVGDGVTDDRAAFTAMAAAKGGLIVFLDKRYNVNGLSLSATTLAIRGMRKPSANAAFTALENGSVLIGNVTIRATSVSLRDFGVDAGSGTGLASTTEGLVVDAPTGQLGKQASARNLAILGSLETSATHSLLVEGFDETSIEDIDAALRHYGVVVKGRGGFVRKVRAYRMGTAAVFIKSDVSASAGGVSDGTVQRMSVSGVVHQANSSNNTAFGVYVLASTASLTGVIVRDVQQSFGLAPVRVAGGGVSTLNAAAVQVSDIRGDNPVTGLDLFGYTYDVKARGIKVTNPSSGNAVQTSGNSTNWSINDVDLLISDPAITATSPASLSGSGAWDNFSVRNPYRTMTIAYSATVVSGTHSGDVVCAGEGAPTMAANWSGTAAGYIPLKATRIPGTNLVHLMGAASPTTGAGAVACTLPAGCRPAATVDVPSINGGSGAVSYTRIYSNGDVQPGAFTVGSLVVFNAIFPAG